MNAVFDLLTQPAGQFVLLPLVASYLAAGLLRLFFGPMRGPLVASASAGAGFVFAYFVAEGLPAWPAAGSSHKLFYLALAGTVVGVILDGEGQHPVRLRAAAVVIPLAAVAWVAAPLPLSELGPGDWNLIIALAAAVLIVFLRASRRSGSTVTAPVQLLVAGLGVAAVAWYAGAIAQAQVGVMLAAAAAGFLAWSWPASRFLPGAALLLGIGVPAVVLAAQMAVWGTASRTALAILVLVFFSDWIAGGIRLGGTVGTAMRPVLVFLVASTVVGAAALASYLLSGAASAP